MAVKFTFAIITDTHIRPPQGDDSSPYAVNDLANDRARYAGRLITQHEPQFTIHLGDMVHTLPHMSTYADACSEAHKILEPLQPNLHFVAGNHDIGDKPMAISPAGPVDEQSEQIYQKHFGNPFYSHEHGQCLFIVINSSLVNSGGHLEAEQKSWLERTLLQADGKRIFLFSHYPPFINSADEDLHYDNYQEPGRSWLLNLARKHNIEAIFSGHVHQFFYNRHGETKMYCFPPTSFTRQDYAELNNIGPTEEFGRNDKGKFSIALIDIHEKGHTLRIQPTDGNMLSESEKSNIQPTTPQPQTPLVIHLRHAWYEAIDLPFNGPMEEFSRKRARNDYTIMRLWQMGITRVRTPLADLIDPVSRKRVLDFAASGIGFTFFTLDIPDTGALNLINEHADLISSLEFITCNSDLTDNDAHFDASKSVIDIPIHIGKAHSSAGEKIQGTKFAHNVSFGFLVSECDAVLSSLEKKRWQDQVNGLVFQANLIDDLTGIARILKDRLVPQSITPVINVRLASASPADGNLDDRAIASRVNEAHELAVEFPAISVQLDTFADIDRGYCPRNGLVDRHYNLRQAGRALAGFDLG